MCWCAGPLPRRHVITIRPCAPLGVRLRMNHRRITPFYFPFEHTWHEKKQKEQVLRNEEEIPEEDSEAKDGSDLAVWLAGCSEHGLQLATFTAEQTDPRYHRDRRLTRWWHFLEGELT